MCRREILVTRLGEMSDMIACMSIYDGGLVEKERKPAKRRFSAFDDCVKLR